MIYSLNKNKLMKTKVLLILFIMMVSCNNNKHAKTTINQVNNKETITQKEISWQGMINNKIPVWIHYQIKDSLVIGEITYLNTKNKKPITLLGNLNTDNSCRLLEFDTTGTITGIIEANITSNSCKGSWFSPIDKKELNISLTPKDTLVASKVTDCKNISGNYHYQYGENGYNGDLNIELLPNSKAAFEIISLTEGNSPNIAEVEKDTITLKNNKFIYHLPDSDCAFEVIFYNNFAYIHYINNACTNQFGMGATVEGIFLKTKN